MSILRQLLDALDFRNRLCAAEIGHPRQTGVKTVKMLPGPVSAVHNPPHEDIGIRVGIRTANHPEIVAHQGGPVRLFLRIDPLLRPITCRLVLPQSRAPPTEGWQTPTDGGRAECADQRLAPCLTRAPAFPFQLMGSRQNGAKQPPRAGWPFAMRVLEREHAPRIRVEAPERKRLPKEYLHRNGPSVFGFLFVGVGVSVRIIVAAAEQIPRGQVNPGHGWVFESRLSDGRLDVDDRRVDGLFAVVNA